MQFYDHHQRTLKIDTVRGSTKEKIMIQKERKMAPANWRFRDQLRMTCLLTAR